MTSYIYYSATVLMNISISRSRKSFFVCFSLSYSRDIWRLLYSPELSVLFLSDRRKMGPLKLLSSLCSGREPWLYNTSGYCQELQSNGTAKHHHTGEQCCAQCFPAPCTDKGRSHGRGSWPDWGHGAAALGSHHNQFSGASAEIDMLPA